MKRISHGDYADFDFLLFGISCNVDELKICWLLNQTFALDLERQPDVEIQHLKSGQLSSFCNFIFEKKNLLQEHVSFVNDGIAATDFDESAVIYQLLGNRHPAGNLIPEQPRIDYFLLIGGEGIPEIDVSAVVHELRKLNDIQAAFVIDVESLKSKHNLIF